MEIPSSKLTFILNLAQATAIMTRTFDRSLGMGLGFNDFFILYHLNMAHDGKMRRIDLAEKVGLTASGITRQLLPMEKIGLVRREASPDDARVSFVTLAPGGKRLLQESMERAELLSEEFIPTTKVRNMKDVSELFKYLSLGRIID